MTRSALRHTTSSPWPDGEGPPRGTCDKCGEPAWCVMLPGNFHEGFICEACAAKLEHCTQHESYAYGCPNCTMAVVNMARATRNYAV